MEYGKLRLSVEGTGNGRGFDIYHDFKDGFNFIEGVSKNEFYFIQPWMQFPNQKYTDACKLVSIELVRRFNEFPELEKQVESKHSYILSLEARIRELEKARY